MTTTEDVTVLPKYYLVHETPAGPRYAYPLPPVPKEADWSGSDKTWSSPDGPIEVVEGRSRNSWDPAVAVSWVISPQPLTSLVFSWTAGAGLGDWAKRDTPRGSDPLVVAAFGWLPDEPSEDTLAHLRSEHDDCPSCIISGGVYHRPPLPRTVHDITVDLTGWAPLPGEPDPDRDQVWTVTDPSTLAVYGQHTAHLWPGSLTGFRAAVVAALKANPLPKNVYDHDRNGTVKVFWNVNWDVPSVRRGKRTAVAFSTHSEIVVPDRLSGSSKAAVLAAWDATVADWVSKFLPAVETAPLACSSCAGRGYKLAEAGR